MASARDADPQAFHFAGEVFGCESQRLRPSSPGKAARDGLQRVALGEDGYLALGEIDGIFALAESGPAATRLYRDRSGLRALYWARGSDDRPVWTEQLLDLVRASDRDRPIARPALHEYLRLLDIAPPLTFIEGVQALEPGVLLTLQPGVHERQEEVAASLGDPPPADFAAAVDELEARLSRSVSVRLNGVARAAAFASSGVDSALICALAARQKPQLHALTVGFDGDDDEAPVAARITGHLGLRHEVLRFGRDDYLRAFDLLARGMDQPMADPATMATVLAFEACRERFDVVLDGTGADEAVGAMPPRHVRLAVGVGSLVPAALRRLLVRAMSNVPGLAGYTPILDFEHPAETLMRWRGFTRLEIEELCGEPVTLEHTTFHRTFARFRRGEHYARYSALYNVMPGDRLTQAIRLTGMRVRFPYFAPQVDGFLRQLPMQWRHLPGQPKRILSELLARYVPRPIWAGPKRGFTFPLHDFLAGDDWALVRRHLLDGPWLRRGLLRPEVVQRCARQYIGGDQRLMFRVWALVVLGAWLDAHPDLTIPPPGA